MAKEKPRNKHYWQQRMAALEDDQYQHSAAYYKDVQRQYARATNSIQMDISRWYQRLADNNDISYAGAKKLLKKNELDEFKWTVEDYIKAGKENAIDQRWMKELENASARHHISYLDAMKIQMQQHAELLSTEFEGGMTDYLHKVYGQQYYHTAFEIAKGTGVGTNLAQMDTRKVDAIIKHPWAQDGENFSDRIWTNKDKLVRNLHTELTQNIIRGESPQKAIDSLSKTMDVSRSQAGRLIMTESAAISSVAQKDCLKDLGVEKYEILATLDNLTSQICQDLDGKVFDMKEYEVGVTAPPFHPNCRSTTVPYFDDEFTEGEQRAARDSAGKTYHVPADMKYREWEGKYVNSKTKVKAPKTESQENYISLGDFRKHRGDTPERMVRLFDEYTKGEFSIIDETAEDAFAYKPDKDVVVINPKHPQYENYNQDEITVHEIAHRIDHNEIGSPMNPAFSTALVEISDRLIENKAYYQSILAPGGRMEYNDLISDIIASITHNEITGISYHDIEYIQQLGNKELEVFADTFTVLYRGDDESVVFIQEELPELCDAFMKMIGVDNV